MTIDGGPRRSGDAGRRRYRTCGTGCRSRSARGGDRRRRMPRRPSTRCAAPPIWPARDGASIAISTARADEPDDDGDDAVHDQPCRGETGRAARPARVAERRQHRVGARCGRGSSCVIVVAVAIRGPAAKRIENDAHGSVPEGAARRCRARAASPSRSRSRRSPDARRSAAPPPSGARRRGAPPANQYRTRRARAASGRAIRDRRRRRTRGSRTPRASR